MQKNNTMTAAQKIAKEKFKKAIAIRQKTGVSLKEAFAEVYGKKKVGAVKKKAAKKVVKKAAPKKAAKKVVKKAAKKVVQKTKPRYSAKKHKNWSTIPEHKRRVNGVPKKKKVSEQSILNKIHKVKDQVNSLDELQHKHMIGGTNNDVYTKMANLNNELIKSEKGLRKWVKLKKSLIDSYGLPNYNNVLKKQKLYISELKKHKSELKKLI